MTTPRIITFLVALFLFSSLLYATLEPANKQKSDTGLAVTEENTPLIQSFQLTTAEQEWISTHPIIRFTGDPYWLPYEAFNSQGEYIGIVAEHLKLIEEKLGLQVKVIPYPGGWSEAVAKVKQGEIDVLSETPDSNLQSQHILEKWGKPKYASHLNYSLLSKIIAISLLGFSIFIYWNRKLAKEVTLRKKLEAQTQAIIDSIPLQILVTSYDGHLLSVNHKVLSEYKAFKDTLDQLNIADFYADPNERKEVIQLLSEQGKVEQKIIAFKHPNGSLRSMMISMLPISFNQQNALLTIAIDMTERLEMEASIRSARETAEAANQAKSEFLANMSHEIRTPMNAIIGFTELLNNQLEDPKLKSFSQTIQSAGNNLLVLINDILDLSKIEAGKLHINKVTCHPHDLFAELEAIFSLKMANKSIDFSLEIADTVPLSLLLDPVRLRQVLFNLTGNAIKFTEQGFIQIKVHGTKQSDSQLDLFIDVIDTGIGIAEDQQQRVFHNFEQSSGQSIRKYGGTGLGLSISKRLVEMMGGEIYLNSQLGQGSTFTIKLLAVDILDSITQDKLNTVKTLSLNDFSAANILVVDDIKDNRTLLHAMFEQTKLHINTANNGLEAVKLCQQQDFDLILMDIKMPEMDGYQAAEKISQFSTTPIVALTASVLKEEFDQIKSSHFAGYLRKPIDTQQLIQELAKYLPQEKEIPTQAQLNITPATLNTLNRANLTSAIEALKKLNEQCEAIRHSNNIAEIEEFSHLLKAASEKYPVTQLQDYSAQLIMAIDSFDIATIKHALQQYPQFIKQLEQLIAE
ncbi:MAG: response regulator [Methyloprofundus sp.]|nr:response regulator [Methyloprofundus sp.]